MSHSAVLSLVLTLAANLVAACLVRTPAHAEDDAIRAATWGSSVGFAPDLNATTPPAGAVIDAASVERVKQLIPSGLAETTCSSRV